MKNLSAAAGTIFMILLFVALPLFLWGRVLLDVFQHPLRALFISLCVIAAATILCVYASYLNCLSAALKVCSAESRAVSPGAVWWLFVPVLNICLSFFFTWAVAKSLTREFDRRSVTNAPSARLWAGWISSICGLVSSCASATLQDNAWFGWLLLGIGAWSWITFWRAISRCTKHLQTAEVSAETLAVATT